MTLRDYIPQPETRCKLRTFSQYTELSIHVWAWLRVIDANRDFARVEVLNGDQLTGEIRTIATCWIAPPLGWESRYTIYCEPEQAEKIISDWFKRGIVVRANHCIGDPAGNAFQPMDNAAAPHWKYPEATDAIPAEQCAKLFRVVVVETEEINFIPRAECPHCKGTGRRPLFELAAIRNQSMETLHTLRLSGELHLDNYDPHTECFDCNCRFGAFRDMGRSKRAKLIKSWKAEGWDVRYIPYAGGFWERTRETIVHDWL